MKLQNRLALSFALFSLIASSLMLVGLYIYARLDRRSILRTHLLDIVTLAANQVNVENHAQLLRPEQENSAIYLVSKQELQNIQGNLADITFIYTMRYLEDENQMEFVVDAETNPQKIAHLGEIYTEISPEMLQLLAKLDEPYVESEFYTDRWGTFLSAYAPLYDVTGRREAILGIDISAENVRRYENQVLQIGLLVLAITTLAMGIVGWWLGRRIASPLAGLTDEVGRLAAGEWRSEAQPPASFRIANGRNDEVNQLWMAFNQMATQLRATLSGLEERVTARTQELKKRSELLESTSQIGRAIASTLDPQQLMNQAVERILERFNLYFVGLYLLDENGEWATMRAGSGQVGDEMARRGTRVLLPSGMIGWSIANGRPRIAQIASEDDVRMADSELPDTRSEAAIPLRSRGRVIGALSLQSREERAFDEATVNILTVMADQVAITLDNANLFAQGQQALQAERSEMGNVGRQAWERLYQAHKSWGYHYQNRMVRASSGEWDDLMLQAAHSGHAIQDQSGRLAMPVKVRDETIGVVSFYRAAAPAQASKENIPQDYWQAEEIEILQAILNEVGQAAESARLYQETQLRASQEQITGEITAHMRESLDMNKVLQTALREIGDKLGPAMNLTRLEVHLGSGGEE